MGGGAHLMSVTSEDDVPICSVSEISPLLLIFSYCDLTDFPVDSQEKLPGKQKQAVKINEILPNIATCISPPSASGLQV